MKYAGLSFLALAVTSFAMAQEAAPRPTPTFAEAVSAFAVQTPDESSPFFADRELAKMERTASARGEVFSASGPNDTAIYPKVRDSDNNAGDTFLGFFTDMFSSVRVGKLRADPTTPTVRVEPREFSLSDRREVDVTYAIKNNTGKIMRIDYPTTQRIEIITSDPNGQVIDRWSDDRAFTAEEGIVFVNPGERIEYSEKLPTRDLKAGEIYTVTGDAAANEGFTATQRVTPTP
jgi:hypothetical protein